MVDVTSYIVNLSCSPIKFLLLWISNRNVFSKYAKIFHYMINRSQYTHSNCSPNPGSMNYTLLIKSFLLYNSRHACSFPCYSCCFKTRLTTVTTLPWIKEFHILGLKLLLIGQIYKKMRRFFKIIASWFINSVLSWHQKPWPSGQEIFYFGRRMPFLFMTSMKWRKVLQKNKRIFYTYISPIEQFW